MVSDIIIAINIPRLIRDDTLRLLNGGEDVHRANRTYADAVTRHVADHLRQVGCRGLAEETTRTGRSVVYAKNGEYAFVSWSWDDELEAATVTVKGPQDLILGLISHLSHTCGFGRGFLKTDTSDQIEHPLCALAAMAKV